MSTAAELPSAVSPNESPSYFSAKDLIICFAASSRVCVPMSCAAIEGLVSMTNISACPEPAYIASEVCRTGSASAATANTKAAARMYWEIRCARYTRRFFSGTNPFQFPSGSDIDTACNLPVRRSSIKVGSNSKRKKENGR